MRNKSSRPWFDKRDLDKVGGDWALAYYYAILKDYANRLTQDKKGFTRVSSKVFEVDLMADRRKKSRSFTVQLVDNPKRLRSSTPRLVA